MLALTQVELAFQQVVSHAVLLAQPDFKANKTCINKSRKLQIANHLRVTSHLLINLNFMILERIKVTSLERVKVIIMEKVKSKVMSLEKAKVMMMTMEKVKVMVLEKVKFTTMKKVKVMVLEKVMIRHTLHFRAMMTQVLLEELSALITEAQMVKVKLEVIVKVKTILQIDLTRMEQNM